MSQVTELNYPSISSMFDYRFSLWQWQPEPMTKVAK